MMLVRKIRVKSARSKKSLVDGTKIVPANPEKSTFRQNILQINLMLPKKFRTFL